MEESKNSFIDEGGRKFYNNSYSSTQDKNQGKERKGTLPIINVQFKRFLLLILISIRHITDKHS